MKTILLLVVILPLFLIACHPKQAQTPAGSAEQIVEDIPTAPLDFTKDVQPILVKNCSPCHFTGGKMYEKMPFDKGETILGHSAGILKRIKEEKENRIISAWIKQGK